MIKLDERRAAKKAVPVPPTVETVIPIAPIAVPPIARVEKPDLVAVATAEARRIEAIWRRRIELGDCLEKRNSQRCGEIEDEVRRWVAKNPKPEEPTGISGGFERTNTRQISRFSSKASGSFTNGDGRTLAD